MARDERTKTVKADGVRETEAATLVQHSETTSG